jgi:hypothetical protein
VAPLAGRLKPRRAISRIRPSRRRKSRSSLSVPQEQGIDVVAREPVAKGAACDSESTSDAGNVATGCSQLGLEDGPLPIAARCGQLLWGLVAVHSPMLWEVEEIIDRR